MNIKLFLAFSINVTIIPCLVGSAAPKETPPLWSKDWLKWAIESSAQKPQAASSTATATAPQESTPATGAKQSAENTIRQKVTFKPAKPVSPCTRCPCEFQTMVDYVPAGDETVEDFYKQKISAALWLALKKNIEGGIQCTKTFMYQPPELFANRGIIKFPAKRVKCKNTAPHMDPKELEIVEIRQIYDHIPAPPLPPMPKASATTATGVVVVATDKDSELVALRAENAQLKNTITQLQAHVAALSIKSNSGASTTK